MRPAPRRVERGRRVVGGRPRGSAGSWTASASWRQARSRSVPRLRAHPHHLGLGFRAQHVGLIGRPGVEQLAGDLFGLFSIGGGGGPRRQRLAPAHLHRLQAHRLASAARAASADAVAPCTV